MIVNRFEQQLLFGTGLRRADVERALEGFLEGTVSNNYKVVREAIDRGLTLDEVKTGSNVSVDLQEDSHERHRRQGARRLIDQMRSIVQASVLRDRETVNRNLPQHVSLRRNPRVFRCLDVSQRA